MITAFIISQNIWKMCKKKKEIAGPADPAFEVYLKKTRLNWLRANPCDPRNDHLYLYLLILVT